MGAVRQGSVTGCHEANTSSVPVPPSVEQITIWLICRFIEGFIDPREATSPTFNFALCLTPAWRG
jgi:hypothetical protein